MTSNVFTYMVYVKGIFGRNRKIKFQGFTLAKDLEEKLTLDQVTEKLEYCLKNTVKPKGEFYLKVCEQPMELEKANGVEIRTFMLYSDNILLQERRAV